MNLTKDQIEKLCEGFDAKKLLRKSDGLKVLKNGTVGHMIAVDAVAAAYALGRQHQAKMDAELCRQVSMDFDEPSLSKMASAAKECAGAIEHSIEVK